MAALTLLIFLLLLRFSTTVTCHHQPFFPVVDSSSPTPSPSSSPLPKMPFSSSSPSPTATTNQPFFLSMKPTPPPPSPTALTSFPANISSILFPHPSSASPRRHVIAIAASVSVSAVLLIVSVAAFLLYRRRHKLHDTAPADDDKTSRTDSLRLFPANTVTSDAVHKQRATPNRTTENFLYLGTLSTAHTTDAGSLATNSISSSKFGASSSRSGSPYQKLGSPELTPLPPLPKHNNFRRSYRHDSDEDDEFFSPRQSSASPKNVTGVENQHLSSDSRNASNTCSPAVSPELHISPTSLKSNSPDSVINFMTPARPDPIPVARSLSSSSMLSERITGNAPNDSPDYLTQMKQSLIRNNSAPKRFVPIRLPPPPPPPPPPVRFWESPVLSPGLSGDGVVENVGPVSAGESSVAEKFEETTPRLKLKPLHWDKVRASSDRAMVWDHLKSSSFQLNEEMIETLFVVNNSSLTPREIARQQIVPSMNQENRVLDPKKSQNIAILLRALNVTNDEVCEALLEGNSDSLGTELLESLLKMSPSKEEERKLNEFRDESPFKLGPAEKFLKAVLDVPYAFKRVDAMLYISNFDSEVDYLKRSFETLESACEELKNSRMFYKLLEAVLKTGNRMNVGTNRGDAHAFKLDTLLKLADVKGTDGKTTLLHFVVQEIIRVEGSRLSGMDQNETAESSQQSSFRDDVEFRKLGLQVVSGLSGELINVKKAAGMDPDVLSNEVAKISGGVAKIDDVVKLIEGSESKDSSRKFFDSMTGFLRKANEEIIMIQAREKLAFCMVKEITEYFHGNSANEEAHRFRIFTVVRDFLSILDKACKVVGKVNKRTIVGSARQFPIAMNAAVPSVFPEPST